MKSSIFARFARAFFLFWHFVDVLVLSTTWNDLFCSCVDDVSIWWQRSILSVLSQKRWFQFNSRIVRTHFASVMTLNNCEIIAEMQSYIFRWRSRCRRCRICLSSLICAHACYAFKFVIVTCMQMKMKHYIMPLVLHVHFANSFLRSDWILAKSSLKEHRSSERSLFFLDICHSEKTLNALSVPCLVAFGMQSCKSFFSCSSVFGGLNRRFGGMLSSNQETSKH